MDKDIKEEVFNCSKCGLCQSVCPIYLATKNEMFLPRGRFINLNNHFNNGAKVSRKFIKNLDVCLNCNLCKQFCPSDIDSVKIYSELKSLYKKGIITKLTRPVLPFVKLFSLIFPFGMFKTEIKRVVSKPTQVKAKVAYFQGCFNRYVNATDKNAAINLLGKYGYETICVINECCGYSMICDGDLKAFNKNSQKIINAIPDGIDYIVCSCDSCYETLKRIPKLQSKLITIDKLLNVTLEDVSYFKPLIRSTDNLPCINKKGDCTLLENFFALKHPVLAKRIGKKLPKITAENPIVTTCQITKAGLKHRTKRKIYTYSEYLWGKTLKENVD